MFVKTFRDKIDLSLGLRMDKTRVEDWSLKFCNRKRDHFGIKQPFVKELMFLAVISLHVFKFT